MATHSSVLAWRIPGTGEPGGLPSMWLHRVGHDWSDLAAAAAVPQTLEWAFKCSLDPIQPLGNQKIQSHSISLMCPETEAEIFSEQYWQLCIFSLENLIHTYCFKNHQKLKQTGGGRMRGANMSIICLTLRYIAGNRSSCLTWGEAVQI